MMNGDEESEEEKYMPRFPFGEAGAGRGTRTSDPLITNQPLYQLSYAGVLAVPNISTVPAGTASRTGPPWERWAW